MAKPFPSASGMVMALDAARMHGGCGDTTGSDPEHDYGDASPMTVDKGTSGIQHDEIARQHINRHAIGS